jgi:DNA-binding transcriptional MerR regulator
MDDKKTQKYEKRAWGFLEADISEWQRITENPILRAAVCRLQMEYGFPLSDVRAVMDWMNWLEPIEIDKEKGELVFGFYGMRRQELDQKLKHLEKEFDISARWSDSLRSWVISGREGPNTLRLGLPGINFHKEDGKLIPNLIVTPETDISNPLVIEMIKIFQEKFNDPPPQPQAIKDSHNKMDWRPVREWRKRHPDVPYKDIARMLNYNLTTIKRALKNSDNGK